MIGDYPDGFPWRFCVAVGLAMTWVLWVTLGVAKRPRPG